MAKVLKPTVFKDELLVYTAIIAGFALLMYLRGDTYHYKLIIKDFTSPVFLFLAALVIVMSYYGLRHKDPDVRASTHHAVTAVIASYFSHLSMVFPAYFFVGFATFFAYKQFGQ
jgi:hypothetical protein